MKDEYLYGIRIKCYATPDNGSFDRFTVAFPNETYDGHSRLVPCVGLSGHGGGMIGRHLGKRVTFKSLPEHLRGTVRTDCREYAKANKQA